MYELDRDTYERAAPHFVIVTMDLVLIHERDVLIVHATEGVMAGHWTLPSGRLDPQQDTECLNMDHFARILLHRHLGLTSYGHVRLLGEQLRRQQDRTYLAKTAAIKCIGRKPKVTLAAKYREAQWVNPHRVRSADDVSRELVRVMTDALTRTI